MSAHTPGPWEADDDLDIIATDSGVLIASVNQAADFPCLDEDEREEAQCECEANADLIAAAPDLLAALQAMVAHYPAGINTMLDEASTAARAAIARATGAAA